MQGDENVVQMRPCPVELDSDEDAERARRKLAAEIEQYASGNPALSSA